MQLQCRLRVLVLRPSRRVVLLLLVILACAASVFAQTQTVRYTYDALGRLTSARYDADRLVVYTYDAAGNHLSIVVRAPSLTVASIAPTSGPPAGGTLVSITGAGFQAGATVTLGGVSASGVSVVSPTSMTASTPAHAPGAVDVIVTNPDSEQWILPGGFAYTVAPSVTTHPTSATRVRGFPVSFTATATGSPTPTVQWQVSTNGGGTWTDRSGANGTTYTFTAALADSGAQFRAVFTNSANSATSGAATLTVREPGVVSDFDGDGQSDMLWRDLATGANAVWYLHGAAHVGTGWLAPEPDLGWALVGTNDFNGDGQADLVWRHLGTGANKVEYLNGLTQSGTDALDTETDLDWLIVGTADLNADSHPDVIWRHRVTGAMRVWYLDGVARTSTAVLDGVADPAWTVVGTADVNRDGRPDLIWRNGATGANRVVSVIPAGSAPIDSEPDVTWSVVGTGDYNEDGAADLLWRHDLTGALRVWYLTATTRVSAGVITSVAVPFTWTVAGMGSSVPNAPTGLTATATGASITLSWAAPTAGGLPTAYVIEAGAAPGLANLAAFSTGGTATSFTTGGVANGRYSLRVRAINGAGSSGPSNESVLVVGTPPPVPPGPPSGLTGTASGSTLTLTWTAPATGGTPTAYQIEAGTWPGIANLATLSTGSAATTFAANGVANGLYYLRVRAASAAGMSAASNEVRVQVGPAPVVVPGAPIGLTGEATGSSITLSWTAPTTGGTPTSYRIEAGSGAGMANLADFSTGSTATTFHATGVSDGRYFLRVRGTNGAGTGRPSNETIMTVGCTAAPASPTGLIFTRSGGTVTFSWNAATGNPTTYVLEAGNAPGLANLVISDLGSSATAFAASGVGAGTYYVRLRAKNLCGTSGVSNEVKVVVP